MKGCVEWRLKRSAAMRLDAGEHTVMLPGPTAWVVGARWSRVSGTRSARPGAVSRLPYLPAAGLRFRFAAAPTRPAAAGVHHR